MKKTTLIGEIASKIKQGKKTIIQKQATSSNRLITVKFGDDSEIQYIVPDSYIRSIKVELKNDLQT